MTYLLFNPISNNNTGTSIKKKAKIDIAKTFSNIEEINVLDLNVNDFLAKLKEEDDIILVGGDGTLNHFVNVVYPLKLKNKMYLYKAGIGNDFLNDVNKENAQIILLNPYLQKLPKVTINGKTSYYINGIGYGIDGEVCVIADKLKDKGKKKINYTTIAIKLLLFKFHCPDAIVIVDGKEYAYKKVWLASAMFGRFYGGGMMMAPNQDRLGDSISLAIAHDASRLRLLTIFPKIFKGEHVKYKKIIEIKKCKKLEVRFSSPCALQIDGEVVKNVTSYVAEIE